MLDTSYHPLVDQLALLVNENQNAPAVGKVIEGLTTAFHATAGSLFWEIKSSLYQLHAGVVDEDADVDTRANLATRLVSTRDGFLDNIGAGHSDSLKIQNQNWIIARLRSPFDHLFLGFSRLENSWTAEETRIAEMCASVCTGLLELHPFWRQVGEIHQIQSSSKRNQQLIRMLAHDFGNYVTTVLGFSELAMHQVKSGLPLQRYLEEVFKSSKQTSLWVSRLRMVPRRDEDRPITMNPGKILDEELKKLADHWQEKIDLQLTLEPLLEPIRIEEIDFKLLIRELVNNGAENSCEKRGTIQIACGLQTLDAVQCLVTLGAPQPGTFLHLQISDDGIGFPEELKDQVIRNLYRTGRPRFRGIGLAMVLGILQSHGGGLIIQPSHSRGTTVEVFLPTYIRNEFSMENNCQD